MLARTKKHPTESIRITGTPEVIGRMRKFAQKFGAEIIESAESVGTSEVSPELDTNPSGVYLRGIRLREDLTQEALANLTGISRSNISAMEHGKRPIGKETAKKLAAALNCEYRRFL
ncbi:helix-turn-helix domain-containing protein [Geomonas propionica]|uniref:Helix-turn-helix transcriptional regulator n=1 Tax=Geomonas propionica TaxID=2798582 RepID=A0ABS0YMQ5_9BACT|nr:helix-turn-helix transcriptional regulator [Geomonas propionica]MBJ6798772.1 helix-turn-helix transcriptional regulator [Geomonas propionica]